MKDNLVEQMARAIMEAYHGGCKVTDWREAEWNPSVAKAIKAANDVLAVARPVILEEAAHTARRQILRSSTIERRTKNLGIRREPLCTEYAEEAADAIRSLIYTVDYEDEASRRATSDPTVNHAGSRQNWP